MAKLSQRTAQKRALAELGNGAIAGKSFEDGRWVYFIGRGKSPDETLWPAEVYAWGPSWEEAFDDLERNRVGLRILLLPPELELLLRAGRLSQAAKNFISRALAHHRRRNGKPDPRLQPRVSRKPANKAERIYQARCGGCVHQNESYASRACRRCIAELESRRPIGSYEIVEEDER